MCLSAYAHTYLCLPLVYLSRYFSVLWLLLRIKKDVQHTGDFDALAVVHRSSVVFPDDGDWWNGAALTT